MSEISPALLASLLREALKEGKSPYLTVVSNSMSPLIRRGDQIRLAPATAEQLQPGEIIVFEGPANLITHRFWGILSNAGPKELKLISRGDRPQHFDIPIEPANLIGTVTGRCRNNNYLDLTQGKGKWLNNHLSNIARLEIRLFATSPVVDKTKQVNNLIRDGLMSTSSNNILVRLIRRFLYSWAIILTLAISLLSSEINQNIED